MPFPDAKYPPKRRGKRTAGERAYDDLLACLRRVRDQLPSPGVDYYGHKVDKACDMIDRAISKAEGWSNGQPTD